MYESLILQLPLKPRALCPEAVKRRRDIAVSVTGSLHCVCSTVAYCSFKPVQKKRAEQDYVIKRAPLTPWTEKKHVHNGNTMEIWHLWTFKKINIQHFSVSYFSKWRKTCLNFIWNNRRHRLRLSLLYLPYDRGGLKFSAVLLGCTVAHYNVLLLLRADPSMGRHLITFTDI